MHESALDRRLLVQRLGTRVVQEPVTREQRAHGIARHAQQRGCAHLTEPAMFEGLFDDQLLHIAQQALAGRAKQTADARADIVLRQRRRRLVRRRIRCERFGKFQVLGADQIAARHQQREVNDVFEFADIAGPRIGQQSLHRVLGEHRLRAFELRAVARAEMLGEQHDVLRSFAQRRQAHTRQIDPVEQIHAEIAGDHGTLQIDIGRGHNPHVDAPRARRAHARHLALLQYAQQFRLEWRREIADFVEKDRAFVCVLEITGAAALRARERARLVTEEFRFGQLRIDGAAIHRDERPLAAADMMDVTRDQFLAGAGLAEYQRGRRAGSDLLDEAQDGGGRRIGENEGFGSNRKRLLVAFRQGDQIGTVGVVIHDPTVSGPMIKLHPRPEL
ncbi:hypothetical protein PSP6_210220 [Paraburkholderia tropica]|nr:hypothetical protein PSP6_210220 [Paraburkholderia tropica]